MASQGVNDSNSGSTPTSEMGSDSSFVATPLIMAPAASASPAADESAANANPTFIQNQLSLQRAPSSAKSTAEALARNLSVRSNASFKSNGSYDAGLSQSAILNVIHNSGDQSPRGRGRDDSCSNLAEAVSDCKLSKSDSTSTQGSLKSAHSSVSVRSIHAVGAYSYGTLRVHSPSPTRSPNGVTFDCLKTGDVLLVDGLRPGIIFAFDLQVKFIEASEPFRGIREVPPGAHFIWAGSDLNSSRIGFWIMSSKRASDEFGEVHVRRWDKHEECLAEEVSAAEVRIQTEEVPKIYESLYPYHGDDRGIMASRSTDPRRRIAALDTAIWPRLTNSIKGALLTKITGKEWNHWQVASTHDSKKDAIIEEPSDYLKHKDEVLGFVFSKDTRTFSTTSSGRERTEQAMDTSSHVQAVISNCCTYEDSDEIVGEMQFCYITGMSLGNLACQEHWAHVIKVVFRAYRLVLLLPTFMRKMIDALHTQMVFDEAYEGSIFDQSSKLEDELKMILITFKSRLTEQFLAQGNYLTPEQTLVGKAFEEFESFLWKWNWDLRGNYVRSGKIQLEDGEIVDAELKDFEAEDERGEYAPVVVEVDEDGRETGLVRF